MLLPQNSALENTPAGVSRRQIMFLDAIAVSIRVMEMTYGGLWQEVQQEKEVASQDVSRLVINVWSFVDGAHRLQALVTQMPGLKHSIPVKSFLKCFKPVTDLRNVNQHLATEIQSMIDSGFPAWGVLSWVEYVSPTKFMIRHQTLGRLSTEAIFQMPNPAGKLMTPPIDHIHLETPELWVNLSELMRGCQTFARRLEKAVADSYRKLPEGASEAELRIEPAVD